MLGYLDVSLGEEPGLTLHVHALPPSFADVGAGHRQGLAALDGELAGVRLALEVVERVDLEHGE